MVIDKMGIASAQAQQLPTPITSLGKLAANGHRLYAKISGNTCIGMIKVGTKKLFVRNRSGGIIEMSPISVLDFYVHESVQRGGHGKELFEKMLQHENVEPRKLAYDRPSSKFKGFLAKHYNLRSHVPQNNNYVVFDDYFEDRGGIPQSKTEMHSRQSSHQMVLKPQFTQPHQMNTITNFSHQNSLVSSSSSGRMFSNLGRDLMNAGTQDSRFNTGFGPQAFQTSFQAGRNSATLQTVNEFQNKNNIQHGTILNNFQDQQGYSPFKAFQNKQQSTVGILQQKQMEAQQSQQIPQSTYQHSGSKHQSLPPRQSGNQNSSQYMNSFYGDIGRYQQVQMNSVTNWHKPSALSDTILSSPQMMMHHRTVFNPINGGMMNTMQQAVNIHRKI
eukprot:403333630